eukprot:8674980-Pyramimonas_sp.AAC.1
MEGMHQLVPGVVRHLPQARDRGEGGQNQAEYDVGHDAAEELLLDDAAETWLEDAAAAEILHEHADDVADADALILDDAADETWLE